MNNYTVPYLALSALPAIAAAPWASLPSLEANQFRPESAPHRPQTQACFFHNQSSLCGRFTVQDRYVRCVYTEPGSRTHCDSCVELFLQPRAKPGYFSFEINCGGTLTALYITDPRRMEGGFFKEFARLAPSETAAVQVRASLPQRIEPEIQTPLTWTLALQFPMMVLEPYVGRLGRLSGQRWRANVYKCGDETSQPHWAAWSPVPELNFHLPQAFGEFIFE